MSDTATATCVHCGQAITRRLDILDMWRHAKDSRPCPAKGSE